MNRYIKPFLALLLGVSLLLCTGCSSLFPYESPEEQDQQGGTQNPITGDPSGDSKKDPIDIQTLQSDDLVYTNTLRNSAGSVLATYAGRVPTFLAPSGYAAPFQRINEHFQVQYDAFDEDCEAYFNRVKQHYGEDWDTVVITETPFQTDISYQLFRAPEHYLSLEFTYATCLDGSNRSTYHLGEVLLLDTGWVLQAAELFGSHFADAQPRILADVTRWGVVRGVLTEGVTVTFTAEELLTNFALSEDKLVLYLEPYTLSATDSASHVVYLDLNDYADLITDIEIPEGSDDSDSSDDGDTTITPDNDLLPQLPGTDSGDGTTPDSGTSDGTGSDTDPGSGSDTGTGTQE